MAKKADTTSLFRLIAAIAAVLLLAAAALTFFQNTGDNPQAGELAALSQALPGQAGAALAGTPEGFDRLDNSLQQLAKLRRSAGSAAPGSTADWQQLHGNGRWIRLFYLVNVVALIIATV